MTTRASGVLVTGVYGVGKTSVVEEMADLLERAEVPYAAIDVDWLWWFSAPDFDNEAAHRVLMANLGAVVENYLEAGVTRFCLAWALRDERALAAMRAALPFPIQVVQLTVGIDLIRERLANDPTAGRQDDLRNAERWLQAGVKSGMKSPLFRGLKRPLISGKNVRWTGGGGCFRIR